MQDLILPLNITLSVLAFSLIAKWYVMPKLFAMKRIRALKLLLIPHTFRHIGLTFLITGVTVTTLDVRFSMPAALGDLLSAALALVALLALSANWRIAIPLVWLFNLAGLVDLLFALLRGFLYVPSTQLGATYFIVAFIVPMLLVTHVTIFKLLLKK